MLVKPDAYETLYETFLREQASTLERNVVIFAATTSCDAVCATKILMAILKHDGVPHSVVPVCDFADLIEQFGGHLGSGSDQEDRTVFLVGMGADEDVHDMLSLHEEQYARVRVIVMDSHRPLHHRNNCDDDGDRLAVLVDPSDGATDIEALPAPSAGESSGSDESEGSAGGSQGANQRRARKRQRRAQHEAEVLRHYSVGSYHGKPAACLAFDLARCLQKDQALHYWWSILGFTEQFIHQMISEDAYSRLVLDMKALIASEGLNEMRRVDEEYDGENSVLVNVPLDSQIDHFEDQRLPLLVHWTLWDALLCSPCLGPRLQTFSEKGRETIKLLLMGMGVPLEPAKGSWTAMSGALQERMQRMMRRIGPKFKFADGWFDSFRWLQGYDEFGLPAVDAVYAVNALVETGGKLTNVDNSNDARRRNFMELLHALGSDSKARLRKGLEAAKVLQRAIVSEGGSTMLRGDFVRVHSALLVFNMADNQFPHKLLQSSPNTLLKLALFLQDAYNHRPRGRRAAVIVVGPKFQEGEEWSALVVGLAQEASTATRGNRFGDVFQLVSEEHGLHAAIQAFDRRIVKVPASRVVTFYEEVVSKCIEEQVLL